MSIVNKTLPIMQAIDSANLDMFEMQLIIDKLQQSIAYKQQVPVSKSVVTTTTGNFNHTNGMYS